MYLAAAKARRSYSKRVFRGMSRQRSAYGAKMRELLRWHPPLLLNKETVRKVFCCQYEFHIALDFAQ